MAVDLLRQERVAGACRCRSGCTDGWNQVAYLNSVSSSSLQAPIHEKLQDGWCCVKSNTVTFAFDVGSSSKGSSNPLGRLALVQLVTSL
jgi:hypothetical protein